MPERWEYPQEHRACLRAHEHRNEIASGREAGREGRREIYHTACGGKTLPPSARLGPRQPRRHHPWPMLRPEAGPLRRRVTQAASALAASRAAGFCDGQTAARFVDAARIPALALAPAAHAACAVRQVYGLQGSVNDALGGHHAVGWSCVEGSASGRGSGPGSGFGSGCDCDCDCRSAWGSASGCGWAPSSAQFPPPAPPRSSPLPPARTPASPRQPWPLARHPTPSPPSLFSAAPPSRAPRNPRTERPRDHLVEEMAK